MEYISVRSRLSPDTQHPQPIDLCYVIGSPEESKRIYALESRRIINPRVITLLIFIAIFVVSFFAFWGFIPGMCAGYALYILIEILQLNAALRRRRREELSDRDAYVEIFEFYEDCFCFAIKKNGELTQMLSCDYSDLKQAYHKDTFFVLYTKTRLYYIPKRCLGTDSPVYEKLLGGTDISAALKKSKRLRTFATVLVWLCALEVIVFVFGQPALLSTVWLIPALLLPLASFIFGLVLVIKRRGFVFNLVFGLLTAFVLLFNAAIPAIVDNYFSYEVQPGDEYVMQLEQLMDIDFMEYETSDTSAHGEGTGAVRYITIQYTEEQWGSISRILTDSRWVRELPTALNSISSPYGGQPYYDYIMIYNLDTGEYNSLPAEDGCYHFITIEFNNEWMRMDIAEYYIDYIA